MINIEDIFFNLGTKIEKNNKLEKKYNLKKNSLEKLTGINKRYISDKNIFAENLALQAIKKINKKTVNKLTHIISVTNTPKVKFPGISNFIANKLNKIQLILLPRKSTEFSLFFWLEDQHISGHFIA